MSQHEILLFLSKYPNEKFTVVEIEKNVYGLKNTLSKSLSKLRQFNEVNYELVPRMKGIISPFYRYWFKGDDDKK